MISWKKLSLSKNQIKSIVSETIQNETKQQKGGFLSMLEGTLGTSLLGHVKE